MLLLPIIQNVPRARYFAQFDGVEDRIEGGILNVSGKQMTLAFMMSGAENLPTTQVAGFFGDHDYQNGIMMLMNKHSSSRTALKFQAYKAGSVVAEFSSNAGSSHIALNGQHHLHIAFNLASSSAHVFKVDGATPSNFTWSSNVNVNLAWSNVSLQIGGGIDSLHDVTTFAPLGFSNVFIDDSYITDTTLFYDNTIGKLKNIGLRGQRVTGSVPLVFLDGYKHFTNRGRGGTFSVSGALTQGELAPI